MTDSVDLRPHFRAAFSLIPRPEARSSFNEIVARIRAWIAQKESVEQGSRFYGAWYYLGGDHKTDSGARVLTVRDGDADSRTPDRWALRYEHRDAAIGSRRWRTDVGISASGGGAFRVSVMVSHWLLPGYLGEEPPTPRPSSPRLLRELLSCPGFDPFSGSTRLPDRPVTLAVGDGAAFLNEIEDPARGAPIVYVSRTYPDGGVPVDPVELSVLLRGVAKVLVAESSVVDKELEQLLPKDYRCWGGRVRVYLPHVRRDVERDHSRHRFFQPDQIAALGLEGTHRALIQWLTRWTLARSAQEVTTLEDVVDARREARLSALRSATDAAPSREWVQLLEEEIAVLQEKLSEAQRELLQMESLRDELDDRAAEVENLRSSQGEAWRQKAAAESRVAELEIATRELVVALEPFGRLPATTSEAIEKIGATFPGRIKFLPSASASARAMDSAGEGPGLPDTWRLLWSMATTLHDLAFGGSVRDLQAEFKTRTGFELALCEGSTTNRDGRLRALRRVTFDGYELDISPHVKIGSDSTSCLRVHFAFLRERSLIVVGHCGGHLETAGTRRM